MDTPEQPAVWPPAPALPPPECADPPEPALLVTWLVESAWISAVVLGVDAGFNLLGHKTLQKWQGGAIIIVTITSLNGFRHWLKDRKERTRAEKRRIKAEKRRPATKL